MCGIAGQFAFDGRQVAPQTLEAMLAHLTRRGPDGQAIYTDACVGFAHARLSIIDLSAAGAQPMVDSELGLSLVFNGTIYNYRELRSFFINEGYSFFSNSDSEVILKAYHHWGEDCVVHLQGDFAFAIWNKSTQQLFLGRDRTGVKPLYYAYTRQAFFFASTPQALFAATHVDTSIDPLALHRHLSLHSVVPAPRTILSGVRKLMPAHTMTVEANGRHQTKRYWSLRTDDLQSEISEQECLPLLEEQMMAAVKKRFLAADVPVGVLLSGGLDSSLIVALLARITDQPINTYTIGFEHRGQELGDEFQYSDLIAKTFATRHHRFRVSDQQLLSRLPEAVEQMSEPMLGQDCIAFYLLSERVQKDIKSVQSGQGADEVFGGYFWYPKIAAASNASLLERFRAHYFDRSHDEYLQTVNPRWHSDDTTTPLIGEMLKDAHSQDEMNSVLQMDVSHLVVDDPVKRVDNMMMAWGVEARVPFLDHQLLEWTMRIPSHLKIAHGGKYILRQLAQQLLPDQIVHRKKAYFPVPALKILDQTFRDMMHDVLTSRAARERGIFNNAYIDQLLQSTQDQLTPIQGNKLWHCTVLEMWMQQHIDAHGN